MKKILVVFTGGTFSMMIDEKTGGAIPRYSGDELLEMIPEAKSLAEIECFDFGKFPGPHVTPELMLDLSIKISAKLDSEKFDGVVVTHGTDTLEETAYFLDLTIKTEIPIVVIGAMKNSSEPDWDGPRNLVDAINICLNENSCVPASARGHPAPPKRPRLRQPGIRPSNAPHRYVVLTPAPRTASIHCAVTGDAGVRPRGPDFAAERA